MTVIDDMNVLLDTTQAQRRTERAVLDRIAREKAYYQAEAHLRATTSGLDSRFDDFMDSVGLARRGGRATFTVVPHIRTPAVAGAGTAPPTGVPPHTVASTQTWYNLTPRAATLLLTVDQMMPTGCVCEVVDKDLSATLVRRAMLGLRTQADPGVDEGQEWSCTPYCGRPGCINGPAPTA